MSSEAFEDFCFHVSLLDYARMDAAMDPLVDLMERTDRVRILGPGTDLAFSIKGMPAIKCAGSSTSPTARCSPRRCKDSVNGILAYNTPSL